MGVIRNTSPLGAEKISGELEEMREILEKLRALRKEEEGRLRGLLQSKGACEQQIQQLETELGEFKKGLQRLAQEGLEPSAKAATEEELVAQWRLSSVSTEVAGVTLWRRTTTTEKTYTSLHFFGPQAGTTCHGDSLWHIIHKPHKPESRASQEDK